MPCDMTDIQLSVFSLLLIGSLNLYTYYFSFLVRHVTTRFPFYLYELPPLWTFVLSDLMYGELNIKICICLLSLQVLDIVSASQENTGLLNLNIVGRSDLSSSWVQVESTPRKSSSYQVFFLLHSSMLVLLNK